MASSLYECLKRIMVALYSSKLIPSPYPEHDDYGYHNSLQFHLIEAIAEIFFPLTYTVDMLLCSNVQVTGLLGFLYRLSIFILVGLKPSLRVFEPNTCSTLEHVSLVNNTRGLSPHPWVF